MQDKIALAIITKNRPQELKRCLASIHKQNLVPDLVIVVDNDQQQSAQAICRNFTKQSTKLKIDYLSIRGSVPHCRNVALSRTKADYLGFIDDDCVLKNSWLKNAMHMITKQNADYVLGKTQLFNPENLFALAQHAHDAYWKNYSKQIFDTKNVLIKLASIKSHQLAFDEKCQKEHYDSADFDFNFQIKQAELRGTFSPYMCLYHQETAQFSRFKKRAFARGFLAKYINDKWQLKDQLVDFDQKNPIMWLLKLIKNYPQDYQKYYPYMSSSVSLIKKLTATVLIRVFEYYYTKGYDRNKQKLKIKN